MVSWSPSPRPSSFDFSTPEFAPRALLRCVFQDLVPPRRCPCPRTPMGSTIEGLHAFPTFAQCVPRLGQGDFRLGACSGTFLMRCTLHHIFRDIASNHLPRPSNR